jgi:hypothetical protein
MGIVRFSLPQELLSNLAAASGIDAAVETGTYLANGTLALREVVSRVWTIELSEELHGRAVSRHGRRAGITFLHGSSADVLPRLLSELDHPVLFWLDAHGGMVDVPSGTVVGMGDAPQCPLMAELEAIRRFPYATASCVLIDDARAFLGPLPQYRPSEWPSLLQIIDLLREGCDRHITILDDVIIVVPMALKEAVDTWWLGQVRDREGRDGYLQTLWEAYNPTPVVALRRLVKSLAPHPLRRAYHRHRWPFPGHGASKVSSETADQVV